MNLSHFDGARSIVVSISRCGRDDLCSNHGGHKHFLYLKKKTKGSCFNSRTTFAKTSLVKQRLKQANAYTTAANSQAVIFFFGSPPPPLPLPSSRDRPRRRRPRRRLDWTLASFGFESLFAPWASVIPFDLCAVS